MTATTTHAANPSTETLLIREARSDDLPRLVRLAQLDSARLPRGHLLVAELEERLVAAVASDGTAIADPFHRTAEIVELLRLRVNQDAAARNRGRSVRAPISARLRLRLAGLTS